MTQLPKSINPPPPSKQLKDYEKEIYVVKSIYGKLARIIERHGVYIVQRNNDDTWEGTYMRSYSFSECVLHILKVYCSEILIENGYHWTNDNEKKWLGKYRYDEEKEDLLPSPEVNKEEIQSLFDLIKPRYISAIIALIVTSLGMVIAICEFSFSITASYFITLFVTFISFLIAKQHEDL